jgi:hypothetical protein
MPIYIYRHPQKEIYKEIIQTMNENHIYFEDEIEWKRVFTVPQASIDTKINPFSSKEFVEKTGNKKGTFGDMMDFSAEMSRQREDKVGTDDPVKRKFFDNYKKNNKVKHVQDKPKVIDNSRFRIDLSS